MCLPANPGTRSYEPFAGWEAVATGWGSTVDRGSRFPDTLMEVPVTVMADRDCRRRFGGGEDTGVSFILLFNISPLS